MKRKIISLFATIALFAVGSYAQTTFGIRAGINFQNINGKDIDGDKLKNDLMICYHIGVNAEIPVAEEFYFQPGLLFITKGSKNSENGGEVKVNLSYVEIPLNLVYKPLLGNGHLILGFGPYIAYGIVGKIKGDEELDVKFKNNVKSSDPDDVAYFRALDAGANMLAGYEFASNLSFQLNTQLGLVKINPSYEGYSDDKTSWKNTGFGFSVGYRF